MNAVTETAAAEPVSGIEIFVPLNKLKKSPNNARKATLRPIDIEGDKAPNYRLLVGTVECGAGWKKTSRQERDYISVKFDDPTFPAPIYATLSETDTAGEYGLIWSR